MAIHRRWCSTPGEAFTDQSFNTVIDRGAAGDEDFRKLLNQLVDAGVVSNCHLRRKDA